MGTGSNEINIDTCLFMAENQNRDYKHNFYEQ